MEKLNKDWMYLKKVLDALLEETVWGCSEYGEMRCSQCIYNVGGESLVCINEEHRYRIKD